MTKQQPPASAGDALGRIAGQIVGGMAEMARICGRTPGTVYNWGNPDTPESVPYDCIIKLDLAYQAAGGVGCPIWESLTIALDAAGADRFADSIALAALVPEVIIETAQACAALAGASQRGADPAARRAARKESQEAIVALQRASLQCEDQEHATGPP